MESFEIRSSIKMFPQSEVGENLAADMQIRDERVRTTGRPVMVEHWALDERSAI
jgi:hypothetical protein